MNDYWIIWDVAKRLWWGKAGKRTQHRTLAQLYKAQDAFAMVKELNADLRSVDMPVATLVRADDI